MSRIAIYPGSFDPLTHGHINIIRRGLRVFDQVLVAVALNIRKKPLFTIEERLEMIKTEFHDTDKVILDTFSDVLLVDYAAQHGAVAILRGLRNVSDFDYEMQMTHMNRRLNPGIETVFMTAQDGLGHISSSLIKEVVGLGGDASSAVPEHVLRRLKEKYAP